MTSSQTAMVNLTPRIPSDSTRYERHSSVSPGHKSIQPGLISLGELLPEYLPSGWSAFVQPEGQLYFYNAKFRVVTDAYLYNPKICKRFETCLYDIDRLAQEAGVTLSNSHELYLYPLEGDDADFGYYIVDHSTRSIFWLSEVDTADLGLCSWTSPSNLKWLIHEQYWTHTEFFPMHVTEYATTVVNELVGILAHARIDHITSSNGTFPYSALQCDQFLELLRPLTNTQTPIPGNFLCAIARIWSQISHTRGLNYFGEETARLSREHRLKPKSTELTFMMKLAFKSLFDLPKSYKTELESLWVDQLVYGELWEKHIVAFINEWQSWALFTMLLLITHILAYSAFIGNAVVALVAIAVSLTGMVSSLCLTQRFRLSKKENIQDVALLLSSYDSPKNGLASLAILYSAPKAAVVWSSILMIAQLIISVFQQAGAIISAIILGGVFVIGVCLYFTLFYLPQPKVEEVVTLTENVVSESWWRWSKTSTTVDVERGEGVRNDKVQ